MMMILCLVFSVVLTFACTDGESTFDNSSLVNNYSYVLAQAACMAQAACTGKATASHRISAIRRNCGSGNLTCNDVCSEDKLTCFKAYDVQKNSTILPQNATDNPEEVIKGLSVVNYVDSSGGCAARDGQCGPNYCCCRGPIL